MEVLNALLYVFDRCPDLVKIVIIVVVLLIILFLIKIILNFLERILIILTNFIKDVLAWFGDKPACIELCRKIIHEDAMFALIIALAFVVESIVVTLVK